MADLEHIMSDRGAPEPSEEMNRQTAQEPLPIPATGDRQEPQEEPQQSPPPAGYVPLGALEAERAGKRKYRDEVATVNQRLAHLQGVLEAMQRQSQPAKAQEPQPEPDFWADPAAYMQQHVSGMVKQTVDPIQNALMYNARLVAEGRHTEEKVKEAVTAFDQAATAGQIDPADQQKIMGSPNPFHAAVEWHKRTAALSEIGTDPAAYRDRLRAEILAEIGQGGQQSAPGAQAAAMPSSFAGARSAGPRTTPQWSGPKPLTELMGR